MKTPLFLFVVLCCGSVTAQEHFAGINTSKRTGILNASVNPAELINIANDMEVHVFAISANMANNKIGFNDLVKSNNFEDQVFQGNTPTSFRAEFDILGPSFAMKIDKWAFAITTAGKTRANITDINTALGRAVINSNNLDNIELATGVLANHTQKATATSWGEIALNAAREIYNDGTHAFSGGIALKLLFPGSYGKMRASDFRGTLLENEGTIALTDAYSNVSFAYSGSLADDFNDTGNFTNYYGNGVNGLAADLGINYRWKDEGSDNTGNYKINAGLSFKNLGSMKFKDSNNESNSYLVNVPNGQYLDLQQFQGASSIKEIEAILQRSGYAAITKSSTDFIVKLPATLNLYADFKVYQNWYITGYTQQKLRQDSDDSQIASQNIVTITPRYSAEKYEVYLPLSDNETSGFTAGIGFRYAGFFIGSGSFITAVFNNSDTHQADGYIGYRFSL